MLSVLAFTPITIGILLKSWILLAGRLGDDDTERPRELRTDEAFKIRLQNWSLKIRTDDVDHPRDVWATITVREQTSTAREGIKGGGRYLVYGITLRSGTPYKLIDTKNEEDSEK